MPKRAEPLTDRKIERLKATEKPLRIGAGGVAGLMLEVTPSGTKTFYSTFRLKRSGNANVTWFKLGQWEKPFLDPTPENPNNMAGFGVDYYRHRAVEINHQVLEGLDPRAIRQENTSRPTWDHLCDLYIKHAEDNLKPRTQTWIKSLIKTHIRGAFPGRYVSDIRRGELVDLHQRIKAAAPTGVVADRVLSVVKKAFKLALAKEWRKDNPCTDMVLVKTVSTRDTFLDADDLGKLGSALLAIEERKGSWRAVALVRLALTTGLRLSEILSLRWDEIDYDKGTITKADHKTSRKTGKPLVQPLSDAAAEVLRGLPHNRLSPWVLPGEPSRAHLVNRPPDEPPKDQHYTGAECAWKMVCKEAGLSNVRFHDLRRTFASWGSLTGQGINIVSKLLNHSDVSVTSRVYAHVNMAAKTEASNAIAGGIKAALAGITS